MEVDQESFLIYKTSKFHEGLMQRKPGSHHSEHVE